jgi:hypothetical protein
MISSIINLIASFGLVASNVPSQAPVLSNPHYKGIRLVLCADWLTGDMWAGTMVHIGNRRYMSADHVAAIGAICFDKETGVQMKTVYNDVSNDFALLDAPRNLDNVIFKFSCKPMITGQTYYSIGWAKGTTLRNIPIKPTWRYTDWNFTIEDKVSYHMRELKGIIIPGMSGGPIVDKNWIIYGINNATDEDMKLSWTRQIADTGLCNKK